MVWHILRFETARLEGLRGVDSFALLWGAGWRCGRCLVVAEMAKRRLGVPSLIYGTTAAIVDDCAPRTNNEILVQD